MRDVIQIAMADKRSVEIDGSVYEVNEGLKALCKKLLLMYEVMIAIFVVIGINVAPMIGSSGFLSDMLFVVIMLYVLYLLFNFIAKKIFRKVLIG